mmetsp:Transcript_33714/g.100097  ORF Transcript_33714/g.100097 Transcript_33714/m.100097 type:complete len:533 (-) Transcript_33714:87-1685(-)
MAGGDDPSLWSRRITSWHYCQGFGFAGDIMVHIKDLDPPWRHLEKLHVGTWFNYSRLEENVKGKGKGKKRQCKAKGIQIVEEPDPSQQEWLESRVQRWELNRISGEPMIGHLDNGVTLSHKCVCDWGGKEPRVQLPPGTEVRYVQSLGKFGEETAQWVTITGWPQADEPDARQDAPAERPAAAVAGRSVADRPWPEGMARADLEKLESAGYSTLGEAMKFKRSQQAWREFAARVGLTDRLIEELARNFGSSVQTMLLDKPRALAQLLLEEFGAHFDKTTPGMRDDLIPMNWLIHDTLKKTMHKQIWQEGRLAPYDADDGYYDGDLAMNAAPKVVFFQASEGGLDPSIYPRLWKPEDGEKRRVLIPPRNLALHTDAFRMYFVSLAEPRAMDPANLGSQGLLQMHMLFLPSDHMCTQFCDEHFLPVNKKTFQPYHHRDGAWHGFGNRNKLAFRGRGVKINVCVAQSVPFTYEQTSIQDVTESGYGGIVRPSHGDLVTPSEPKVTCKHFASGNCMDPYCTWYHDDRDELWHDGEW